jgi:GNAT superfamily N-acetyltransferase
MRIRDAHESERNALWALAVRSKAAWGYSEGFMAACAEELAPTDLSMAGVMVANESPDADPPRETPVGFYTLELEAKADGRKGVPVLELGHLFVEPGHWGHGIGKRLLAHACTRARERGHRELVIQGDPNARGFYERCGARRVGNRISNSIPGRTLPLFVLAL